MNKPEPEAHHSQQGSALILAIMMMMAFGLMGLNMVNQHLNAALALTRSEKSFLQSWELAVSSLNWGLNRRWVLQPVEGWQCAQSVTENVSLPGEISATLRSCIRNAERDELYLLRGEGKIQPDSVPVLLYQLVTLKTVDATESRVIPIQNGWLDFCPLKDGRKCDDP